MSEEAVEDKEDIVNNGSEDEFSDSSDGSSSAEECHTPHESESRGYFSNSLLFPYISFA